MRQESRSLGTQPATEPPQSVTGDLTEMWGWGGSPNLPSNLKQHREVYLNKLPFSPGWSALDWPEKWAVAVFSERLPGGGVAPGYLTLRVPFWMAGGEAARCCGPLLGQQSSACQGWDGWAGKQLRRGSFHPDPQTGFLMESLTDPLP